MSEAADTNAEVLTEIRGLKEAFEDGIEALVSTGRELVGLRIDLNNATAKSDRRARTFRWLWSGLGAAMAVAVAVGVVVVVHYADEQECSRKWSDATAARTNTLAAASDARITALNRVLDLRTRSGPDSAAVMRAIAAAASAGDAYQQVARANPPIPPEQVFCARGVQPRPTENP